VDPATIADFFLGGLPDDVLISAFGNRMLHADMADVPTIVPGTELLDLAEEPHLTFENIAPILSEHFHIELKRSDPVKEHLDEIEKILSERRDLIEILYPIITRLYKTPYKEVAIYEDYREIPDYEE